MSIGSTGIDHMSDPFKLSFGKLKSLLLKEEVGGHGLLPPPVFSSAPTVNLTQLEDLADGELVIQF